MAAEQLHWRDVFADQVDPVVHYEAYFVVFEEQPNRRRDETRSLCWT